MEVAWVNTQSEGYRRPITLFVSGTIVTGYAVPGADWMKWADEINTIIFADVDKYAEYVGTDLTTEDVADTGFIHLVDAVAFSGDTRLRVGHWRGLIERVDGWTSAAMEM